MPSIERSIGAVISAAVVLSLVACESQGPRMEPVPESAAPAQQAEENQQPAGRPYAPDPVKGSTPGGVVVRHQKSIVQPLEARCAETERLVGGGCNGRYAPRGWPVGYGKTDTMGAGWMCGLDDDIHQAGTVHAYALCQVPAPLADGRAPATKASTVGSSKVNDPLGDRR